MSPQEAVARWLQQWAERYQLQSQLTGSGCVVRWGPHTGRELYLTLEPEQMQLNARLDQTSWPPVVGVYHYADPDSLQRLERDLNRLRIHL